jgi:methylamine dehydrogenase accessory protein MauD
MNTLLLISTIVLWVAVLALAFFLLGTLRALGLLSWRLEQLQMTTPSRLGRDGLKVGKKAPDFTLPSTTNGDVALHDFAGRKVLLVFTQSGCGPCHAVVPELNRVHDQGEHRVLVVNNGDPEATRNWATESGVRFPVLAQEKFALSKRYQVFATPFAFLINEKGVITSKGTVGSRQYLGYVLTGAGNRAKEGHVEAEPDETEKGGTEDSISPKEVSHV